MWDNIGGKIKGFAKFIAWLGIIASIIGGIVLFVIGGNMRYGSGAYVGLGFLVIIGGSLISWISSWFWYGFGELIEKTSEIEYNTRANKNSGLQSSNLSNSGNRSIVGNKLQKRCKRCKKEVDDDYSACPYCGNDTFE